MTLLDRYFMRTVAGFSAMVMGALLTLNALFLFAGEQADIGEGSYSAGDALQFTLLNLPQHLFELMPIGVLLGSLLGLGALARGSELIVARAAGVSIARVGAAVAMGGLALAVLAGVVGEYMAPPLQKFARQQKAFAKSGDLNLAGGGTWVKDGDTIISVEEGVGNRLLGGVYVFRFATPQSLASVASAAHAAPSPDGRTWRLERYAATEFTPEGVRAKHAAVDALRTDVDPGFLDVARSEPRKLPSRDLWRLIGHLRVNGLETGPYEFAFWSRLARTCAIVVVALLAVPFAFGPLRSSGAGARLLVGVLLGVGFFLLQRMLESGVVVFELDPTLLAWTPTALLAALTAVLVSSTR